MESTYLYGLESGIQSAIVSAEQIQVTAKPKEIEMIVRFSDKHS